MLLSSCSLNCTKFTQQKKNPSYVFQLEERGQFNAFLIEILCFELKTVHKHLKKVPLKVIKQSKVLFSEVPSAIETLSRYFLSTISGVVMKKFFHLTPISVSTHSFTVFLCHRKKESFSEYLPIFIYGKASEREVNFSHLKNWVTKR